MLRELVILTACSTLTFGMPVLSSYWYAPRTFFVPYTPLVQPPSTTTLFVNAPSPRSAENPPAENPPAENPPAETPAPPPEFVMPTTGAGWVDFVFAHMLFGVGDEEAGLIRSVLTPQYDRFAQIAAPTPTPAAVEPAPESVVMATVTVSSTPLRLPMPTPRGGGSSGSNSTSEVTIGGENPTLELLVRSAPSNPLITPEPSTLAMIGLGIVGVWLGRRR